MIHKINEYLYSLPEDTLNAFIGTVLVIFLCLAFVGYAITQNDDTDNYDNWSNEENI